MMDTEIFGGDLGATLRRIKTDSSGAFRRSYNFRDITVTGYSTLTRIDRMEIIPGNASYFLDLVEITGTNTSSVAIRVDIAEGTGGTVLDSIVIPATSVASKIYTVPIPASEKDHNWNAKVNQSGEISDNPVTITLVVVKNDTY